MNLHIQKKNSESVTDQDFLMSNFGMLRFLCIASIIFAIFLFVYEFYLYGSDTLVVYLEFCATATSDLLNTVLGMNTVITEAIGGVKTKIFSEPESEAYIIVAHGCDASTVFAVLISTIAAWPGRWLMKTGVLILGFLIMLGLNILRIAGMLVVEVYWPEQFDLFHEGILPSLLVFGALAYFYVWTVISGRHPSDS